jgi:hypothetical protein
LPVRVLSHLFRRLFLDSLQQAFERQQLQFFSALSPLAEPSAFARYLAPLRHTKWVVYAKPPFGGPQQVLDYLGRYTHRVAIANHRLVSLEDETVTFRWKDYRHHNKPKLMTLAVEEFIRRFLLHVLPNGFQRIRHYGLLGNCHRQAKLARCRALLAVLPPLLALPNASLNYRIRYALLTGGSLERCPSCQQGRMVRIEILPASWAGRSGPRKDSS